MSFQYSGIPSRTMPFMSKKIMSMRLWHCFSSSFCFWSVYAILQPGSFLKIRWHNQNNQIQISSPRHCRIAAMFSCMVTSKVILSVSSSSFYPLWSEHVIHKLVFGLRNGHQRIGTFASRCHSWYTFYRKLIFPTLK